MRAFTALCRGVEANELFGSTHPPQVCVALRWGGALAAAGRAAFPVLARALFVQLLPSSRLLLRRRQTLLVGARALSAAFAAVAVVAHGGACCLAF